MNLRSMLARVAVLLFSLSLLAAYVVYSHVTPNTPPPDPLGLNEVESKQEPDTPDFDGILKADNTTPSTKRSENDLRIISSKVINQPIFRVADRDRQKTMPEMRVATAEFKTPGFQMVRNLEVIPGPGDSAALPFDSLLKRPADALERPENIGRIMADDGEAAAREGRMITPESLSADYYRALQRRKLMMSGSKSGRLHFELPIFIWRPLSPSPPSTIKP